MPASVPARVLVLALSCAAIGAGIGLLAGAWERAGVRAALAEAPVPEEPLRPEAVAAAVRAMKLVTVEIDTTVTLRRGDTSWRGDVVADLTVPVRLSYGTDLSSVRGESVGYSALDGLVVRIPAPTRLATEVFPEREAATVETGWLRLRSRAGEYYLGIARRDAARAARELQLRPDDQAQVERVTREQVEALLRALTDGRVPVRVVIERAETTR
jgi:nucleoid-associated protein YgaU